MCDRTSRLVAKGMFLLRMFYLPKKIIIVPFRPLRMRLSVLSLGSYLQVVKPLLFILFIYYVIVHEVQIH